MGRLDRVLLTGVTEECLHTTRRIEALEKLRRRYQKKVRTTRTSAKLTQLVDELFGRPRVLLEDVQKMLGHVWAKSAQRAIDRLVDLNILHEVTGARRNRSTWRTRLFRFLRPENRAIARKLHNDFHVVRKARRRRTVARISRDLRRRAQRLWFHKIDGAG
jgi:hypothetical protein